MCGSGDVGGAGCGLSSDTKVKAMKSHALAERIRVETMGLSDSQKSPIFTRVSGNPGYVPVNALA